MVCKTDRKLKKRMGSIESEVHFSLQCVHKVAGKQQQRRRQQQRPGQEAGSEHRCCCCCLRTNTNTHTHAHTKDKLLPMHVRQAATAAAKAPAWSLQPRRRPKSIELPVAYAQDCRRPSEGERGGSFIRDNH